jgi:PAS domain S-box-containing protein
MSTALRLLIVEDSDDDAQLMLINLRRAGYEPDYIRVDNEPDLQAALQQSGWQVVVSDYAMPGFSGLEALQLLRRQHPHLPFILVSGTVGEEIAVEAMRKGANDYIMKDNLTRLVPAIERELRESRERFDRQCAEEALYQERERALITLHSIGDGVISTDATGRVDYMNPVAENVTGWSSSDALGEHLTTVLPLIDEVTRLALESPAATTLRIGRIVSVAEQPGVQRRNLYRADI